MNNLDFKSIHLNWLSTHKDFKPRHSEDWDVPYYEIMKFTYSQTNATQEYAQRCFVEDMTWHKQVQTVINEYLTAKTSSVRHFITIGLNHQTWSIPLGIKLIETILHFDWVESGKAVFELHRENGIHPHIHFLIDSKLPKSKILEKIWATKGIKKIVLQKSFIDYKPAMPYHEKYIVGDKTEDKIIYVNKDSVWRVENNIKHLYEKMI